MNARHTKEQEKYRFHMFYTNAFFLILTFVSYNYHFEGQNCKGWLESESLAKILDFLVISGRDESMSHSGTRKI